MSSSDSNSESSFYSEDDEINFEIEVEDDEGEHGSQASCEESTDVAYAYADEPIADEEWLKKYEKDEEEDQKQEEALRARLDGRERVDSWCSCGNCSRDTLQNLSECYCCKELEGCTEAMSSEIVLQDLQDATISCITDHPGFNPVCLQKWSLRMAAQRITTKTKQRYRQTGSEESYLRSIAYREFSRLVYGFLGNKRIPLPSCAYTAIRKEFPIGKDESFTGFDLDDDEDDE